MEASKSNHLVKSFRFVKQLCFNSLWAVLLIGLMGWGFVYLTTQVNGESMYPTLKDEQSLLIRHRIVLETDAKRDDIISFYSKRYNKNIIKRVIGVAGDSVEIQGNQVFLNGTLLEEPYLAEDAWNLDGAEDLTITIPEGYLFVMGDNRNNSVDSRHEELGLIHEKEAVIGRLIFAFNAK